MSEKMLSFLIGYLIAVNIISYIYILLNAKTSVITIKEKTKDLISVILSMIGGFVGILLGAEMLGYKQDKKLYKKWIPFIVFVEICIILIIVYENTKNDGPQLVN